MSSLYFIPCTFQIAEGTTKVRGFAICSSPDNPITFIYPDGSAYAGKDIWDYTLQHYDPWGQYEIIK